MNFNRLSSELPEGPLPCDRKREDGITVHSLTGHAIQELERHKWIESQKYNRDVGNDAYNDWLDHCWKGWTRAKLMEHLYGWRCWGPLTRRITVYLPAAPSTTRATRNLGKGR